MCLCVCRFAIFQTYNFDICYHSAGMLLYVLHTVYCNGKNFLHVYKSETVDCEWIKNCLTIFCVSWISNVKIKPKMNKPTLGYWDLRGVSWIEIFFLNLIFEISNFFFIFIIVGSTNPFDVGICRCWLCW